MKKRKMRWPNGLRAFLLLVFFFTDSDSLFPNQELCGPTSWLEKRRKPIISALSKRLKKDGTPLDLFTSSSQDDNKKKFISDRMLLWKTPLWTLNFQKPLSSFIVFLRKIVSTPEATFPNSSQKCKNMYIEGISRVIFRRNLPAVHVEFACHHYVFTFIKFS